MTKKMNYDVDGEEEETQRPPRQGHRKSRKGCLRCKQRRVKCNEQAPCQNCHRRGEKCSLVLAEDQLEKSRPRADSTPRNSEYTSSPSDPWGFLPATQQHHVVADTTTIASVVKADWCTDLYLMHNFTKVASRIVNNKKGSVFWRSLVIEEALVYPWLMHGLLSLSASHLSSTRPEQARKFSLLVSHHQHLALPGFRDALSKRSEENCRALFAIAAIFPILSLAEISQGRIAEDGDEDHVLDELVQFLILSRGLYTSLEPLWEYLMRPPMHDLAAGARIDDYTKFTLPAELRAQITMLESLAQNNNIAEHARSAYSFAIRKLEEVYKDILFLNVDERDETGCLLKWAVSSEQAFQALLSDRDEIALIIMAHWVILLSAINKWFVAGFSPRAFRAISAALPQSSDVQECIQWPRQQLAGGLPAFAAGRLAG